MKFPTCNISRIPKPNFPWKVFRKFLEIYKKLSTLLQLLSAVTVYYVSIPATFYLFHLYHILNIVVFVSPSRPTLWPASAVSCCCLQKLKCRQMISDEFWDFWSEKLKWASRVTVPFLSCVEGCLQRLTTTSLACPNFFVAFAKFDDFYSVSCDVNQWEHRLLCHIQL